jgi:hypothetical protein
VEEAAGLDAVAFVATGVEEVSLVIASESSSSTISVAFPVTGDGVGEGSLHRVKA